MPKFTVISDPNQTAGGLTDFRIHKAGCKDIQRHIKKPAFHMAGNHWDVEAESAEEVVQREVKSFEEQDMAITADDFTILPCCKGH